MKELEAQALEYLEDTKSLRIPDKHKELVKLLKRVRLDQDRDTRHACADAVKAIPLTGRGIWNIDKVEAVNACINVKAL